MTVPSRKGGRTVSGQKIVESHPKLVRIEFEISWSLVSSDQVSGPQ